MAEKPPFGTLADWYEAEFVPQPDITTYELALVISSTAIGARALGVAICLPRYTLQPHFPAEEWSQIEKVRRHFREIVKPPPPPSLLNRIRGALS